MKENTLLFLRRQKVLIALTLLLLIALERSLKTIAYEKQKLTLEFQHINEELEIAISKNKSLEEEIGSFSDPAFIELLIKSELGMTPEGQIKVVYVKKPKSASSEPYESLKSQR